MFYTTHSHIFTWVVAIVLFIAAVALFKKGMAKQVKILHMALRLFYILIIITGGILFFQFAGINHMLYGLKFVSGLAVISFSEMYMIRMKKGKPLNGMLIGLVVSLLVTLYLGFGLPIGFNFMPL
ncbi:YisL family protein [Salipaludibacillus aurantiacus]|uniref:UPF0344 protein SAMN05518684_105313 n=1 Tax=Salipaludibacillus aurantiacus TaxID=1601833 RepID=A0A1H9TFX9_9BACI|nr:YisL family protein [Salipaludibacillus aurantiacus]SER96006.1 Protein of unknown function [Salipaludibacillus aurantiacus]